MHVLTCPDVLQLFSPMWVKTINISIYGNFCQGSIYKQINWLYKLYKLLNFGMLAMKITVMKNVLMLAV